MVPSIYGENMFDDFFDGSFFGGHSPLFGKHARNLMKTDIRETDDANFKPESSILIAIKFF